MSISWIENSRTQNPRGFVFNPLPCDSSQKSKQYRYCCYDYSKHPLNHCLITITVNNITRTFISSSTLDILYIFKNFDPIFVFHVRDITFKFALSRFSVEPFEFGSIAKSIARSQAKELVGVGWRDRSATGTTVEGTCEHPTRRTEWLQERRTKLPRRLVGIQGSEFSRGRLVASRAGACTGRRAGQSFLDQDDESRRVSSAGLAT